MKLRSRARSALRFLVPSPYLGHLNEPWRLDAHYRNWCNEIKAARAVRNIRAARHQSGGKNRFVIYARSRSGATFLLDLLQSHPQIGGENYGGDAELLAYRWFFPTRYIENRALLSPAPTYGFKAKPEELILVQHVSPPRFLARLHCRGWKIVHVRRRNILRQVVSFEIGLQTRVWHDFKDTEDGAQTARDKITISSVNLLRLLESFTRWDEDEKRALDNVPHCALIYEDDLQRTETQNASANRIFEFLGLPPHDVQTRFVRTGDNDIFKRVKNADEVRAAVLASPYAHFLDD